MKPLTVTSPVTVDIRREEPGPAKLKPGSERVDAFTVRYTGEDFWRVFHAMFYEKPDFPLPD